MTDALLRLAAAITRAPHVTDWPRRRPHPRTRPPGIRLRIDADVPADTRRDVIEAVTWLRHAQPVRHAIVLYVVREATLTHRTDGRKAVGTFFVPKAGPNSRRVRTLLIPMYVAAGHAQRIHRAAKCPRQAAIGGVLGVLFHEWSHYEQWRDGKPVTEFGRDVRARSLLMQFRAVTPWRRYSRRAA